MSDKEVCHTHDTLDFPSVWLEGPIVQQIKPTKLRQTEIPVVNGWAVYTAGSLPFDSDLWVQAQANAVPDPFTEDQSGVQVQRWFNPETGEVFHWHNLSMGGNTNDLNRFLRTDPVLNSTPEGRSQFEMFINSQRPWVHLSDSSLQVYQTNQPNNVLLLLDENGFTPKLSMTEPDKFGKPNGHIRDPYRFMMRKGGFMFELLSSAIINPKKPKSPRALVIGVQVRAEPRLDAVLRAMEPIIKGGTFDQAELQRVIYVYVDIRPMPEIV